MHEPIGRLVFLSGIAFGRGGSGERWLSPSQRCSQLQLCFSSFKTLSARRPQLAIRTSNKNCIFARGRCVAAALGPLASRGRRRAGSGDKSIARRNNYTRRLDRFSFQEVWLGKNGVSSAQKPISCWFISRTLTANSVPVYPSKKL